MCSNANDSTEVPDPSDEKPFQEYPKFGYPNNNNSMYGPTGNKMSTEKFNTKVSSSTTSPLHTSISAKDSTSGNSNSLKSYHEEIRILKTEIKDKNTLIHQLNVSILHSLHSQYMTYKSSR